MCRVKLFNFDRYTTDKHVKRIKLLSYAIIRSDVLEWRRKVFLCGVLKHSICTNANKESESSSIIFIPVYIL